jgi:hypothetical protein
LAGLYDKLLKHATTSFSAEDVMTFLGRKLHPNFAGDWSLAGHFAFLDGSAGGGSLTQVIMDDFGPEGEAHAGSTRHVCEFTTGDAGQLSIELIATWTDFVAHETVIMQAQRDLTVAP